MVGVPVTRDAGYFQGVNKNSSGYKLMAAMGWKEGEGLGASKQGIKEHLKVRKKHDNAGVGKTEADARVRDWTLGMMAYDNVLSGLTEITSQHASQSDAVDSDEESDASGGEDQSAAVEKATKKRKKSKLAIQRAAGKKAKKAKAEEVTKTKEKVADKTARKGGLKSKDAAGKGAKKNVTFAEVKSGGESTVTAAPPPVASSSGSDSGDSDAGDAQRPKVPQRVSHRGRYQRREASKAVRSYSSTDLAAIIGAVGGGQQDEPAVQPAVAGGSYPPPAPLYDSNNNDDDDDSRDATAKRTATGGEATCSGGATASASQSDCAQVCVAEGSRVWWMSCFVRAGSMGSAQHKLPPTGRAKVNVNGFSEQDQVDLYSLTKDGERQGRKGLGSRTSAALLGNGTRTVLDSDDDGDDAPPPTDDRATTLPEAPGQAGNKERGTCAAALANDGIVVLPPRQSAGTAGAVEGQGTVEVTATVHTTEPGQAKELDNLAVRKRKKQKGDTRNVKGDTRSAKGDTRSAKGDTRSAKESWRKVKGGGGVADDVADVNGVKQAAVKWKRTLRKVLAAAPDGKMKVKKLQRRALEMAGLTGADAEALLAISATLQSPKFVMTGKYVALAC